MILNKKIKDKLNSYISRGSHTKSGCESIFWEHNGLGYKVFFDNASNGSLKARDWSFWAQSSGYRSGKAPKTFHRFSITVDKYLYKTNIKLYGYTTEIAKQHTKASFREKLRKFTNSLNDVDNNGLLKKPSITLRFKNKKYDCVFRDYGDRNLGFIGKSPVIVDWGLCSFSLFKKNTPPNSCTSVYSTIK